MLISSGRILFDDECIQIKIILGENNPDRFNDTLHILLYRILLLIVDLKPVTAPDRLTELPQNVRIPDRMGKLHIMVLLIGDQVRYQLHIAQWHTAFHQLIEQCFHLLFAKRPAL